MINHIKNQINYKITLFIMQKKTKISNLKFQIKDSGS